MRERRSHKRQFEWCEANGKWAAILTSIQRELAGVIARRPSHGSCIKHGGEDGLRCFDDFDETGA